MSKTFRFVCQQSVATLIAILLVAGSTLSAETSSDIKSKSINQDREQPITLAQATFNYIKPTDWDFQALQDFAKRYNCIPRSANSTQLGDRPLTRSEFVTLLNIFQHRSSD